MPQLMGNTALVGVFGYPVGHSLSPCMHNAAFDVLGMDWAYLAFNVQPKNLRQALLSLPVLGIRGVNLTIPHKEAAAAIVDEMTPEARALEAVNTVDVQGSRLIGHNTDGAGFLRSLAETGISVTQKQIVIIGAGGAARAIAIAVAGQYPIHLTIANRTRARAEELAQRLSNTAPTISVCVCSLQDVELEGHIRSADVVINTTSVGMHPYADVSPPFSTDWLHTNQSVVDIIYRPAQTTLLRDAAARGCITLNGASMLVWQGAEAFTLWTGIAAPVSRMQEALLNALAQESTGG